MKAMGHLVLLVGGVVLMYPILFMILAGLLTRTEFLQTDLGLFPIAEQPTLKNYAYLLTSAEISYTIVNSLLRTVYVVFLSVLTSLLGGYAFARLQFKGKEPLFLGLLFTQMLPATIALVPLYLEFARWPFAGGNAIFTGGSGILNTWWVYALGGPSINVIGGGVSIYIIGAFLVRQSLEKLPVELDEAAKVDGAGMLRFIFTIVAPLQLPVLAFIAITVGILTWNDWTFSFFYASAAELQTLAGQIALLTLGRGVIVPPDFPLIITLGLGLTVPSLLIFFIFQKFIVQGLANTGIKG